MPITFPPGVKTAAVVQNVVEVSLLGSADYGYWASRLKPQRLEPAQDDAGRARLMLLAAQFRFKGVLAREMSVSVVVAPPAEANGERAAFLEQAFVSVRCFAWVERTMFKSPYSHARVTVHVAPAPAVSVTLSDGGGVTFAMAPDCDVPLTPLDDDWRGRIHLPGPAGSPRRLFYARLLGPAQTRPFTPNDRFEQRASPRAAHTRLRESDFRPETWGVRTDAIHAKSRTVPA